MRLKSTEAQIQASIIEYLTAKKYFVQRCNAGVAFLPCGKGKFRKIQLFDKGFPDLQVSYFDPDLRIGICDYIEVKSEKGKQSPDQKEMQKKLEDLGFNYYLFRSVDECMEIFQ